MKPIKLITLVVLCFFVGPIISFASSLQVRNGKAGTIRVEIANEPQGSEPRRIIAVVEIAERGSTRIHLPLEVIDTKRVSYRITYYGGPRINEPWTNTWIREQGGVRYIEAF